MLEYKIKINKPGSYRFNWHSKVGAGNESTEHNDSWLRIPDGSDFYAVKSNTTDTLRPKGICSDNCPEGSGKDGWFKVYLSATTGWTWSTKTSDNNGYYIYADFDTAGIYTVQISGRSQNHFIDRFVLFHHETIGDDVATNLNNPESSCDNSITPAYDIEVLVEDDQGAITDAEVIFDNGPSKLTDGSGIVQYNNISRSTGYVIEATKAGYIPASTKVNVLSDKQYRINLEKMPVSIIQQENNKEQNHVYPNPASDNIIFSYQTEVQFVTVLNTKGQKVLTHTFNNENILDVSELNEGIYILIINTADKIFHEKIQIIH
ncbi:MAG: T9SS type A sorting domain-containing protein [Bacteroidetes bacterium]|nr:T9SS type A sorting domain-containing protein [Bacteroidota bacterium]